MITKEASRYLSKQAGFVDSIKNFVNDFEDDPAYKAKAILGTNSLSDHLSHYGNKAISAISPLGDKIKQFANDSIRGYKDLYKNIVKDPDFMRSLKAPEAMSELWHRANKSVGRRLAAKMHENAANEATNFAKTLEPAAKAFENGKAALKSVGKQLLEKVSPKSKSTPRAEYIGMGGNWV